MAKRKSAETAPIHWCSKEVEIELLKKDNEQIKQMIKDIHKSIVGNGQPGMKSEVQELKIIQKSHIETILIHGKILNNLNLRLAIYSGAIGVIVFLITYFGNHFIGG